MPKDTQRRRLVDDDGFTFVGRRRNLHARSEAFTAPDYRRYLLTGQEGDSPFQAVQRLEKAHPDLRVRITERGGKVSLTAKDNETEFCLARLRREGTTCGVTLHEEELKARGVVLRYPLSYALEPLQQHPCVIFAKRCQKRTGHGRIEPTRQVEVEFRGTLPTSLNLGFWGVYSVRSFVPEPLRCFNCQGFGHVQKHCSRRALCGVCSQRHPTSECIRALKDGERPMAHCPNCSGRHHAWAPYCPERLRRLPPRARGRTPRAQQVSVSPARSRSPSGPVDPPPAPPSVPEATGRRKRQRRRRRRRRTSSAASEAPSTPPADNEFTDAATQTKPATRDAATQSKPATTPRKFAVEWCPCERKEVHGSLLKINDQTWRWRVTDSKNIDKAEAIIKEVNNVIARLHIELRTLKGLDKPCSSCFPDGESSDEELSYQVDVCGSPK